MAAPNTLLEFRTQDKNAAEQALDDTRAQLAAAVAAEAQANAAYTQASNDLTTRRDALDKARKALAVIPMPADGDVLVAAMRGAMVAWRKAGVVHVAADDKRLRARDQRQRLGDRAGALAARLDAAKGALKDEIDASGKRDELVAAVTTGPLKDLAKQAGDAMNASGAGAHAKVDADLPKNADPTKSLLDRVRARRSLATGVTSDASEVATAAISTSATFDEKSPRASARTPRLQRAFDLAVSRLRAFVNAAPRVPQAAATLDTLANRALSPLTDAQRAEIFTADAALKTKREAALAKLAARDAAQQALAAAQVAYDKGLFAAQVASPDKTDADLKSIDPLKTLAATLKTKQDDLTAAEQQLKDADPVAPDSDADLLQKWFAAVPDALWDQLDQLDAAEADLKVIAAINPANDLVKPMQDAEKALAQNLDAVAQERVLDERIGVVLDSRQSSAGEAREVALRRTLAAARFTAEV